MSTPQDLIFRADQYAQRRAVRRHGELGHGKDGTVWRTSRPSALKVHATRTSYHYELDAYIRLRDLNLRNIRGFIVPLLLDNDDELLAMEIEIVTPPF